MQARVNNLRNQFSMHSPEEILHNATNQSEGDLWSATHHFGTGPAGQQQTAGAICVE
jgi:hypothetical protein